MAAPTSRIFMLLLALTVSLVFFFLCWENLSVGINWALFVGENTAEYRWSESSAGGKSSTASSTSTQPPTTTTTTTTARPAVAETPMPVLYRKDFPKLPVWDFEDVYNQDPPPAWPTCAGSLRRSEDEAFRRAFLPNIRLFLHKDSINMSEWNRLSHFNNPFGFMDYKYEDVMTSLRLIPRPTEPLLRPKPGGDGCVHCAVVGTAGILNGSRMGEEIDAHDYVFRMNGAVIKGYEEDVGRRTSVYVHTAHSITSSGYFFKKYGYKSVPNDEGIKFVMIPEGMRDFQWLEGLLKGERVTTGPYRNTRPRTYYAERFNETRFYVLHQDFLRYVRNRFLKSKNLNAKFWAIVRPTNGAFTLFLALHTCDVVHAYGFMTEDYKKYSNYYFQRHEKTHVVFYANHDYLMEMRLWKRLHDSNVMRLYQGAGPGAGAGAGPGAGPGAGAAQKP